MTISSDIFLTIPNLTNVARQVSINAIIAVGMTFIIITAGIDLSVGSLVALTGCVAMMGISAGILLGELGGTPIIKFEGRFRFLGQGMIFVFPVPILITAAVITLMHLVLKKTSFGAHVYAVGGNEEASRLSGIKVAVVKFKVYIIGGMLTGLAGMVLMGRLSSAQPNTGEGFELDAIAAVILGGTSLMGGRGGIWGTLVGALIIGILNNGFNLMSVDAHYQLVAKGVIILLAVLLDQYLKKY